MTNPKIGEAAIQLKIAQYYAMAQLFQIPAVQEFIGETFKHLKEEKKC